MDVLWSPWRYDYISSGGADLSSTGCVFCNILNDPAADEQKLILLRAEFNFVILNAYPYVSGHLMIVPYEHLADLDQALKSSTDEMMDLTKRSQTALRNIYSPDGFNFGMNLGRAAGAGVAGHFHQHVLPRWYGDVNFMTSVGQTRTIPEDLAVTFTKLQGNI